MTALREAKTVILATLEGKPSTSFQKIRRRLSLLFLAAWMLSLCPKPKRWDTTSSGMVAHPECLARTHGRARQRHQSGKTRHNTYLVPLRQPSASDLLYAGL